MSAHEGSSMASENAKAAAEAVCRVDDAERAASDIGTLDHLLATAKLLGFDDWAQIARRARKGHADAIELLCRRAERGL